MLIVNRENFEDAKKVVDYLLDDITVKHSLLTFLSNAIIYSNGLKSNNWNLNLDKSGRFIRLNVGHEYCIEIFKEYAQIIVLKDVLKDVLINKLNNQNLKIYFKGYEGKKRVSTEDLLSVPDCLVKVPNSVACYATHEKIIDALPYLEESNRRFISYAIQNTTQLPLMRKAHSIGFILYLSEFTLKNIPNPTYINIISENDFYYNKQLQEKEAKTLTIFELEDRIVNRTKATERINVTASRFSRNPYIVEYAKRLANGICQDCKQPAPFVNKLTNEPFLETHHIIPLAQDGMDTIENTIAVCPNCHRKRHYG